MLFRDACEFTPKPRRLRMLDFERIPFVPMDLIPEGSLLSARFVLRDSTSIGSGTYFEPGDILLARITPCFENGKQTIIAKLPLSFGVATTEVIPFRERPGISDKTYLFFYLLRPDVRAELASRMEGSTGRQRLTKARLENLPINLPPIPEQLAISSVLKTVWNAREARERELLLERECKAALMEHVFTFGVNAPAERELKVVNRRKAPADWDIKRLEDCAFIQTGVAKGRKQIGRAHV